MIRPGSVFNIDVQPTVHKLGVLLGNDNGKLCVRSINEKTYLYDEGRVQIGDILIAINGEDSSNLKHNDAAELLKSLLSNEETIVLSFQRPHSLVPMNKEEEKAWDKVLRQQKKQKKIQDKLKSSFADTIGDYSVIEFTPPERKPFIEGFDNMKPLFNIGDYVKVFADTSPGKNREEGYGFIKNVRGYGGATIVDVEYTKGHHGGLHKDIPINHITPAVYGSDWCDDILGRKKRIPAPYTSNN